MLTTAGLTRCVSVRGSRATSGDASARQIRGWSTLRPPPDPRCHNALQVNSCLDHIGSWMAAACSNYSARDSPQHAGNSLSVPLPRSFCHDEFLCALEMLLSSEHFQVLIKTLTLVYSNCGRFVGQHRRQLCHDMLVGIFFNKLFMHWCSEVRPRLCRISPAALSCNPLPLVCRSDDDSTTSLCTSSTGAGCARHHLYRNRNRCRPCRDRGARHDRPARMDWLPLAQARPAMLPVSHRRRTVPVPGLARVRIS